MKGLNFHHIIMMAILMLLMNSFDNNCNVSNSAIGCLKCNQTLLLIFNTSANKMICTNDSNYSNCILVNTVGCQQCLPNYKLENAKCQQKNYSIQIENCINQTNGQCYSCREIYMNQSSNCTIYNCKIFNYQKQKCQQCNQSSILHSRGQYCYKEISNCIWYNQLGCRLCSYGYIMQENNCTQTTSQIEIWKNSQIEQFNLNSSYQCADLCIQCNISNKICTACQWGYYLSFQSTCQSCSSQNCKMCLIQNSTLECIQCQVSYNLYKGKCFKCPSNYGFFIASQSCQKCADGNCSHCLNQNHCLWCNDEYLVNNNLNCSKIPQDLTQNALHEYLFKTLNGSLGLIYNNQQKLLSSCSGQSNGYSCICNNSKQTSSLCYNISQKKEDIMNIVKNYTNIDISLLMSKGDDIRMQAQIFPQSYTFKLNQSLRMPDFANYLQIMTFLIIKNVSTAAEIYKYTLNNMTQVFNNQLCTIIKGMNYYFHYKPQNIICNQLNAYLTTDYSKDEIVYVWFPRQYVSSGFIYVWINSATEKTVQLALKRLYNPKQKNTYEIYKNNISTNNLASINQNYFSLQINASKESVQNYYFINSSISTTYSDPFTSQRIENIIYQDSFFYILIFLILYFIFIPLCSIVDIIDNRSHKRKKINSNDLTESNNQSNSSQKNSSSEEILININYRDFFPIYNIANTPRPQRLLKLCLFILNMQHGVIFLCLMYFNLPFDSQIIVILLSIPAYLCTVIMSYCCGFLARKLPGFFKYCINIIVICYWISWVLLMNLFSNPQYKKFIYIFLIVFILIDIATDSLQTLVVNFIIKQQEQQSAIFQCLASWLSLRGYFQLEKFQQQEQES